MELTVFEIKNLIAAGVQIGMELQVEMNKHNVMLKKREVYRFLQVIGEKPVLLDIMIKDGLIKGERGGKAINSPILFKKSDILMAINAIRIKRL
jgi:hypothetical protein